MTHEPTPLTTSPKRRAGVCLHISSLPGAYGIGEIGAAARQFVDTLCNMKLSVWQFLPLGPTAYGDSPYQSLSTFAGNEMVIDIDDLVDLGLLERDEVTELTTLPEHYADFGALIPVKTRLLNLASLRFAEVASESLRAELAEFQSRNDSEWLHDYALFRVLKTRHDERPWPQWQTEYVHRDESVLRALEDNAAKQIEAIKIQQFLFFRQWSRLRDYAQSKGVLLFGDMPIYIALDSADAWAKRELVRIDENGTPDYVAGVPPDYFSADGQLWGNPLYDWEQHAADGYRWWVKRLRALSELTDLVRIDHFRGFESYWSIPADAQTARIGSWEQGPGDAVFVAMQDALGTLPIIAEDLGLITPEVEGLRDRHQFPGMRVLQFEVCDPNFELSHVNENSVCYTGTHDNDTTVGWFRGSPDNMRSAHEIYETQQAAMRITGGSADTIHTDLIKSAFSTKANLAIAPLQDYLGLGSEARFNTPGTTSGNWRWRVLAKQLSAEVCDEVKPMVLAAER